MKKDDLEKQYKQITELYDLAEELASTVESKFFSNQEEQITLIEPLISQVAETADLLSEEYVSLFEVPLRKKSAKTRVESILRKLYDNLVTSRRRIKFLLSAFVRFWYRLRVEVTDIPAKEKTQECLAAAIV